MGKILLIIEDSLVSGNIGNDIPIGNWGTEGYFGKFFFSFTFWVIIIVIIMNVILGIILDAFGQLRDDRNNQLKEIESFCLVCGEAEEVFQTNSKNFVEHKKYDHSLYSYVCFLTVILTHPKNRLEHWAAAKIEKNDVSFFPVTRSLALNK